MERDQTYQILRKAIAVDKLDNYREPCRAQTLAVHQWNGFKLENVVIEGARGMMIPANFYLPALSPPFPVVLAPVGHWMIEGKKAMHWIGAALVEMGIACLTFDPPGQGERLNPEELHQYGVEGLLAGLPNAAFRVGDCLRCLNYLQTRSEVKKDRIGMFGSSGGGEMTFYTSALDPRVTAAVVCNFVTSYRQFIKFGGAHCIDNHIPGIVACLEQADIASLIAPRPLLLMNGRFDPQFPIWGTKETAAQVSDFYIRVGAEEKFDTVTDEINHQLSPFLAHKMLEWFNRWLLDETGHVPEITGLTRLKQQAEVEMISPQLQVFHEKPAGTRTLFTVLKEEAARLIGEPEKEARVSRERVREFLNFDLVKEELYPTIDHQGNLEFFADPEKRCGGRLVKRDPSRVVIIISDNPWGEEMPGEDWESLSVLYLQPEEYGVDPVREWALATSGMLNGHTLFARWVSNVTRAVDVLSNLGFRKTGLFGRDFAGLIAIWAAALEINIAATVTFGTWDSYQEAFAKPRDKQLDLFEREPDQLPIGFTLPNLLSFCDLPDLKSLIRPRPFSAVSGWSAAGGFFGRTL